MFSTISSKLICQNCEKAEEEDFQKVKEYVDDNGEATLYTIIRETGVGLKRISKFIREGRLEISRGLRDAFRCESCGAPISTGRYCESCFTTMKTELLEATRPVQDDNQGRMHSRRRSL